MIWKTTLAFLVTFFKSAEFSPALKLVYKNSGRNVTAIPVYTFLLLLFFGLNITSVFAQSGCNSQNVIVTDFFFGDADQNEIDPNDGFEIGEPINGYIFASFGGSAGNGFSLYIEYEIFINDVGQGLVQTCLFNGQQIPRGTIEAVASFTWNYGDKIEIKNYYMDWLTNKSLRTCERLGRNAQCFQIPPGEGFIIRTPLVAYFSYTQSCESFVVSFTNLTSGGNPDTYTYEWDFDGLGSSTEKDPFFDFQQPGDYTVTLTSTDGTDINVYSDVVSVHGVAIADAPENVEACDSYTLPALDNGAYFASEGGVDPIAVGTEITATQTIYVFTAGEGSCEYAENSFTVTITNTPTAPLAQSQTVCSDGTEDQTLTATAEGMNITWYTAAEGGTVVQNPVQVGVGSTTYYAQSADGDCINTSRTAVTLTINDVPATPVVASTTQPTCDVATGSFSITAVEGLEYNLNGGTYSATTSFEGLAAGTYNVTARNADGCVSAVTSVTINEAQDLAAPVIASTVQPDCESETGSFTVVSVDGVSYSINGTDYQTAAQFTNLAPGSYNVTARNEAGCVSAATMVVINEAQSNEPIQTTSVDLCIEDATFDLNELLLGDFDESGIWEDPAQTGALTGNRIDPSRLAVGNYTFNYVLGGSCPSTTVVAVSINDDCVVLPCGLEDIRSSISKAVTPNGDGHNDFFSVDIDTDCGFTFNVKIFNRWGAEVFAQNNYRNTWDGQSNRSVTSSNQLPSGTYYYILEIIGSGFAPIQGYIFLGTK